MGNTFYAQTTTQVAKYIKIKVVTAGAGRLRKDTLYNVRNMFLR